MINKYTLTDNTIIHEGRTLHQIKAVADFWNVHAGDVGGFIESVNNLSQIGNAWVSGNAKVYGNAWVFGDAQICDNALIEDNAKVHGNAWVCHDAKISGYAEIYGHAVVAGHATVCDNTKVYCHAIVRGNAIVRDNADVGGTAEICKDAQVTSIMDYIVFKNWWSSGRCFTWTRSNNMWKVGCFYGTGEELIKKAYSDSRLSGREYERVVKYVEQIINTPK